MSTLPHIGQTRRNRRDLRLITGAQSYAAHHDVSASWELERSERTEMLPAEPLLFVWPTPAEPEPIESPIPLAAIAGLCIGAPAIGAAVWYAAQWAVNVFLGVSV